MGGCTGSKPPQPKKQESQLQSSQMAIQKQRNASAQQVPASEALQIKETAALENDRLLDGAAGNGVSVLDMLTEHEHMMRANEQNQSEDYDQIHEGIEKSVLAAYVQRIDRSAFDEKLRLDGNNSASQMNSVLSSFQQQGNVVASSMKNNTSEKKLKEIQLLISLIEQNSEQADIIRGKDIVIILGATGVGKSTSINYLLGKKLVWSKIKNETKSYVYEVEGITVAKGESEAAKIGTKPMESQTKSISVYKLIQKQNKQKEITAAPELLLCDTPGLLDSQGAIVDIANQVGIVKALRHANSVKVLLLIGYKNLVSVEGKGKLMKEVIQLYSKLIRDFSKCENSVLVGFTHLNADTQIVSISNSLKAMTDNDDFPDVNEDDEEGNEQQQQTLIFLKSVIKSLDTKSNKCALIRPLVPDQRQSLVDSLFGISSISQDRIEDNFSYALAQNTKNDFQLSLMGIVKEISNVYFPRGDYVAVTDRLKALKKLTDHLDFAFVSRAYSDAVSAVLLPDFVKNVMIQISRLPNEQVEHLPRLIQDIVKAANYLAWTDSVRSEHSQISDRLSSFSELVELLCAALEKTASSIQLTHSFRVQSVDFARLYTVYFCKEFEVQMKKHQRNLISLGVYSESGGEGQKKKLKSIFEVNYYKAACKSSLEGIEMLVEKLNQADEDIDAAELEVMLTSVKEINEFGVGVHVQIDAEKLYTTCVGKWKQLLRQKLKLFDVNFKNYDELQSERLQEMRDAYEFIMKINGHSRLVDNHFTEVSEILSNLTSKLVKEGTSLMQDITNLTKLKDIMNPLVVAMSIMEFNEDIRHKLQGPSQSIFAHLGTLVQKLDSKFASCLEGVKIRMQPKLQLQKHVDKKRAQGLLTVMKSIHLDGSQEFEDIDKYLSSMKKILDKLSNQFFSKFAFFQTAEKKCKINLNAFILATSKQSKTATNDNNLNLLYAFKQSTLVVLNDYSTIQQSQFEEIINIVAHALESKVSPLLDGLLTVQIPHSLDNEVGFQSLEERLKQIDSNEDFTRKFTDVIILDEQQSLKQNLEELVQKTYSINVEFNNRLNAVIRHQVFDFEADEQAVNSLINLDATVVKLILDSFQKLSHYPFVYSRLSTNFNSQDIYKAVVDMAISAQRVSIKEIQDYIQDRGEATTHENILKKLAKIRSFGLIYQTHFAGKLQNPAEQLLDDVQMKQKGLDKQAKQILKSNNFESINEFMRSVGQGSESYKAIKKCIKEKLNAIAEEIKKALTQRTFEDEQATLRLQEHYNLLYQASLKLSDIPFNKFSVARIFAMSKQQLHEFLKGVETKFLNTLTSANNSSVDNSMRSTISEMSWHSKIEKSSRKLSVVQTATHSLSNFIEDRTDLNLPNSLTQVIKQVIQQIQLAIDIKNQQTTDSSLDAVRSLSVKHIQFSKDYILLKQNTTKKLLEQAHVFANSRVEESETVSVNGIFKALQREYSYVLEYLLDNPNSEEEQQRFFQSVLVRIQTSIEEVDQLFVARDSETIIRMINTSKSTIVCKQLLCRFKNICQNIKQAFETSNFSYATSFFKFASQIFENTRSFQYEELKADFNNLTAHMKQTFNNSEVSAVSAVGLLLSDSAVAGQLQWISSYIAYCQFVHQYQAHLSIPTHYNAFFAKAAEILETIQQQLNMSVTQLDAKGFCTIVRLIDTLEQQKTSFNTVQVNVIDLLKTSLNIVNSNLASSERLRVVLNKGLWTLKQIQTDMLNKKIKDLTDESTKLMGEKRYKEVAITMKKLEDFSRLTQETKLMINIREISALVQKKHGEFVREADVRIKQGIFDARLFAVIEDTSAVERDFQQFSLTGSNSQADRIVRDIEKYIEELADEIIKNKSPLETEDDVKDFVSSLTNIRRIGFEIGQVHEYVTPQLGRVLSMKFATFSPQIISDVSTKLRKDRLGLLIIQENSQNFEGILNKMLEEVSKNQFSLEYVNKNTIGDNFIASEFSQQYNTYETNWKAMLSAWHQGSINAADILQKTKTVFKKFVTSYGNVYLREQTTTWNATQKLELAVMLAHLSAFWSIVNCQRRDDSFRKLHPVQVSTVMRLLSIDTTTSMYNWQNHLVQVKTGEGKSIVLGITSSFLALLGFGVDCCCYSSYLSQRDFTSFQSIFESLEIRGNIKYATFEQQFEDIINDPTDIRKMGLDLILNRLRKCTPSTILRQSRRILLIDEVDFFFGEDFIGRTYPVALYYNNQDVIDILKFIWQNRSMHISTFQQTDVYKKLFIRNPNLIQFQSFIDERIKMMYEDVNNLEGHRYLTYTPSGKSKTIICYKSLDGVSFNTVKGYKTAFAYIQEWEKKNITEDVMNENLSIIINVGCFSFAQIPQQYSLVLGVSGTLEDMNEYQKQLTQNLFNIKKLTVAPSIYGQSKFSFRSESDVLVKENRAQFNVEIVGQIDSAVKAKRAVIVFFESKKSLDLFKNETRLKTDLQILSEETNFKGHTIIKAGSMGMVTLATRPFGRGCDFITTDPELDINGGIHIIQTFLSEDLAEETQIKGRTARQAQRGSYSIIINREDLIKNFFMPAEQRRLNYEYLDGLRKRTQRDREQVQQAKLKGTLSQHKESLQLKQILLNYSPQNKEEVVELLLKFNRIADRTENKTNQYDFYSDFAGKIGIYEGAFEYDEYSNPKNIGLGSDGSFNDQSLLIGLFYSEEGLDEDIQALLIPVLRHKGFKKCDVVQKESDFIAKITDYDQVWVISGYKFNSTGLERTFQDAVEGHLRRQRGLMIWADNNPYIVHANLILSRIPIGLYSKQPIHIKLDGSDYGDQVLRAGNYFEAGQFSPHLITTGINNLHEGITICYPQVISNTPKDNFGHLNIIGLSSASKPCFFVLSGTEDRGRIVFDCGFTKLMRDQWNTAGTVTYVTNCYAWLYWKERFVNNGA